MLRARAVCHSRRSALSASAIAGRYYATYAASRTNSTLDQRLISKYPPGHQTHGFEILQTAPVPEFSLVAVLLKHQHTGAQHLHLDNPQDHNNVFSIAFKTNPPDSTGVPHILEHTTLCGSTKFPVRDPFFKMTNRSLSNFMNAMTGHDYTFYPFATTNRKDFENLMDVYLSSVLSPLLKSQDFLQEGWRLENADVADAKSALEFKGVVFNEMKGQYSNTMYYFYIKFLESIYPSLNNSGGDPLKMTSLSYEGLVSFHANNYHPSNSKTFTYGNLPLDDHLKRLDEYYRGFDKRVCNVDVKQPIFFASTNGGEKQSTYDVTVKGPVDTMVNKDISHQFHSSVTWYLGNPLEPRMHYELFKWKILGSLLFDGHGSPFYQELIEGGYSEDFSANSGLDSTTALFSFTVGLNFLTKEKVDRLEAKILAILQNKVVPELQNPQSVYHERVKALLHQIEIGFKKHKPDFGFGLLSALVPSWVNGVDPINQLKVEEICDIFKREFEQSGLSMFEKMLNESLLNSKTPKFKFTMEPQQDFSKVVADKEASNLKQKVEQLTTEDKESIYNRNLKLLESQAQEEDASVLPTLTMEDIAKQGDFYSIMHSNMDNTTVAKRIVDTNGLVYVYALKDIPYLPTKYYKYLPLFNSCLTNLAGTTTTTTTELETKIQMYTGGIGFGAKASTNPYNINEMKLQYSLSGAALKQNASYVYNLWHEILTETKLDAEEDVIDKLSTLIRNLAQNQINNIADRGHSYACGESNAKLTPAKYVGELMNGLPQVQLIMEMNSKLEESGKEYLANELLPILREIRRYVLRGQFRYRIVGDESIVKENEPLIAKFDHGISLSSSSTTTPPPKPEAAARGLAELLDNFNYNHRTEKQLINLPFQVGYSSLAKRGAAYSTKDGAALQILSQLYTFKTLHSKIREQNGAYGGGLNFDGLGGTLNFYSYRDPNAVKSIETFESTFAYGLDANWSDKDLTEAKLRVFQSVDAPINIASQGATSFFEDISDELRQQRRENFLSTTNSDLVDVAQRYLVGEPQNIITVIGDQELLKVDDSWKVRNLKLAQ
ncbi:uncharacterized protein LODBEIA_P34860 [Lodderomyces beijingensis]|uniref:Presequence protease, mitochondrial n=1 Tax=Lodderomyces beijingensis TaxID=1775926 RepID=A0ABP0ZPJ2_9ASCO